MQHQRHLFISYARQDAAIARKIAAALERRGVPVWWDFQLKPGHDFREMIASRIDAAGHVIVIWSPSSIVSGFVLDEASRANQQGKLLPLAVHGTQAPLGFGHLHTLQMNDVEFAADEIVSIISGTEPLRRTKRATSKVSMYARVLLLGGGITIAAVATVWGLVDQRSIDRLVNQYRYGSELNYVTYRSKNMGIEFVYPMKQLTLDTTKEQQRRLPMMNYKGEIEVEIYRSSLSIRDPIQSSALEQKAVLQAGHTINYVAPQVNPEKKNWYVISGKLADGRDYYFRRWHTSGDMVSIEFRTQPELKALYDKIIPDMTLGGIRIHEPE
jgi:hypothetical protein